MVDVCCCHLWFVLIAFLLLFFVYCMISLNIMLFVYAQMVNKFTNVSNWRPSDWISSCLLLDSRTSYGIWPLYEFLKSEEEKNYLYLKYLYINVLYVWSIIFNFDRNTIFLSFEIMEGMGSFSLFSHIARKWLILF